MSVPDRLTADVEAMVAEGYQVAIHEAGGSRFYVVVAAVELPSAYEPRSTDVLMVADYQYPMSALDMFYTFPHVRCANGLHPQNADQFMTFDDAPETADIPWQRWSYHYPGWNPAHHTVGTHFDVFIERITQGS
jgi:hypothetical protein